MRHHVLVDSRDRDFERHPRPDTYRIRLPRSYRNVVGARLLSADVPTSFFVFSAARRTNSMQVRVGGVPRTITIADGNYDPASMQEALGTALAAAYPSKTFALDVDARTMQLLVRCEDGDAVAVDTTRHSTGPATDWGLAYYLGFPRGAVTDAARAPGMLNLNPVTYILLDIQELGAIDEGGMYGSAVGRGAFCKIPVPAVSFEYVFRDVDVATDLVDSKPLVPRLETLTIQFRYHDGRPVDFRGVEHSFLLELVTRDPAPLPAVPFHLPPTAVAQPTRKAAVAVTAAPAPAKAAVVAVPQPRWNRRSLGLGLGALALGGGAWWYFTR